MKNVDYTLYLVTDRNQPAPGTFEKVVFLYIVIINNNASINRVIPTKTL